MRMASQKSSRSEDRSAKPPRRRRGHQRVAELLDAAAQAFAEDGYDAATMTDIAARAGAAIGSLYQFFPTKEHLAAAIHGRQLDDLDAMLDRLVDDVRGSPLPAIADRLFAGLVTFLEANPAFVVLGERRSVDPSVKKAARVRLRSRIEALTAAADPPPPPARLPALAAVMLHLIRAAAQLRADDDHTIRAAAVAELQAMLRSHLAGVGD